MTDVTNNVKTNFAANVAGFTGPMRGLVSSASSAVSSVRGFASSLMGLPAMIAGVAGGFGLSQIIAVNSQFEQAQRTIGGTFTALGMAGDFNSGLQMAADTMATIERDAAALPGDAADYIQVFQTALPSMQAVGNVFQEQGHSIAQFSNRFAAVANTFGVDMVQAGSDLSRMLAAGRGQVEMMSPTWMRLAPFIKTTATQMGLTVNSASDFNKLTEAQRALLLQNTVYQGGLNDMLVAAGQSWDAQLGTLEASGKSILRLATGPLFEGAVNSLTGVNEWLTANQDTIIETGKAISTYIVGGFRIAGRMVERVWNVATEFGAAIAKSPGFAMLLHAGANISGAMSGLGAQMGAFTAPGGVMDPSALMGNIMSVFDTFGSLLETTSAALGPVVTYITELGATVFGVTNAVLPPLVSAISSILQPSIQLVGVLAGIGAMFVAHVRPTLIMLAQKVGGLATSIASVLHPAMRLLGAAVSWVAQKFETYLAPVINTVGEVLGGMIDALSRFVSWIGRLIGSVADSTLGPERAQQRRATENSTGAAEQLAEATRQATEAAAAERAAARPTPSGRGGGGVHQDFRGSRFQIEQKYAEGFDPDRIAVAFASDLGRLGEYRLQSGLQTAFSQY